jgi:hypothetical protein
MTDSELSSPIAAGRLVSVATREPPERIAADHFCFRVASPGTWMMPPRARNRFYKISLMDDSYDGIAPDEAAAHHGDLEPAFRSQHEAVGISEKKTPKSEETNHALQSLGKLGLDRNQYNSARVSKGARITAV